MIKLGCSLAKYLVGIAVYSQKHIPGDQSISPITSPAYHKARTNVECDLTTCRALWFVCVFSLLTLRRIDFAETKGCSLRNIFSKNPCFPDLGPSSVYAEVR